MKIKLKDKKEIRDKHITLKEDIKSLKDKKLEKILLEILKKIK